MTDTNKPGGQTSSDAKGLKEEIREKGSSAAEAAKDTAKDYAERARDEAYARGEEYRDYAADETGKVASALRQASEDLAAGSPQERMVGRIADEVAEAADRMRGMTIDDVLSETTHFARRHPGAFLAGSALIGFAAARFLKASARNGGNYHEPVGSYPPPAPRPAGSAGVARPMPSSAAGSTTATSAEPIPSPATKPAGSTSTTSPAGTPRKFGHHVCSRIDRRHDGSGGNQHARLDLTSGQHGQFRVQQQRREEQH